MKSYKTFAAFSLIAALIGTLLSTMAFGRGCGGGHSGGHCGGHGGSSQRPSQNRPPRPHEITVTIDGGFHPNKIKTSTGREMRLTFVRKETSGCGNVVRFPELTESKGGEAVTVERVLQPGEKTLIVFTPKIKGTFHFTCGEAMYQGSLVVK